MADKFRYSFDLTKKLEEQLQQGMLASGQQAVTSSLGMMSADPPAKELQEAEQSKYDPYSFIQEYKDMLFGMFGGEEEYNKVVAQQDAQLPKEQDPLKKVTEPYFKIIDVPQQPPVQVEQLEPDTESTQLAIRKATEQTLGIMQIQEYLDKIKKEQEKTELKTPDFVVETPKEETSKQGLMTKPYDADRMKDINEPLGEGKLSKRSIEESEDFNPIEIQEALEVTADGIIGNQTRKAIGSYQAGVGLPATGFVDRETLKAIRAGKEASEPTNMSFTQESAAGQALSSVEDMYYNPYSLNHQPRLRGNRRHNSGLTIGAGFDLGQKNKQDLLNMGVSEELADKLEKSGWLGLRPSNAVSGEQDSFRTAGHAEMHRLYREQANNGTLLTLTPSEIDELTEAEYNYRQEQIKKKYEDSGYGDWSLVSDEAKIALTVEQYHRGNLGDNWKLFFEKAQQNDVKGITDLYLYSERANPVLRSLGLT